MKNGIFISYRRSDSQGMAGRIYDYLLKYFPRNTLFFDVDNIAPGENFETGVIKAVGQCNTMLVIIGPNWLKEISTINTTGKKDWVELEISTAIKQNLKIIPVLLEDTPMLAQEDLPEILQPLSLRNALSVRHISFGPNMQTLVSALKEKPSATTLNKAPAAKPFMKKLFRIAALLVIATGLFFLGRMFFKNKDSKTSVVQFLKKELNSPESKQMEAFGGQSGALRVPKKKILIFHVPIIDNDSFDLKEERLLNDFSYKGLITIKVGSDKTYESLSSKTLETSLTKKGEKLLIGETMDTYYLNAFDYGEPELISNKESGDTIYITFRIGSIKNKTPVYDLIEEKYKQKIEKDIQEIGKGKLLKTKDGFKIIQE